MRTVGNRSRAAFTIIELLVVIAIMTLLAGLLMPAIQKAREVANRAACANNLKQIGLAFQNYHATNNILPRGRSCDDGGGSWTVIILPYLEQGNLHAEWTLEKSYYEQSDTARQTAVKTYYCPTRRTPTTAPRLSLSGDTPMDGPLAGTHFPGALADYAANLGTHRPSFS
jgi:prepilin-type N-terminal cleavage/methylation domain-containing protein